MSLVDLAYESRIQFRLRLSEPRALVTSPAPAVRMELQVVQGHAWRNFGVGIVEGAVVSADAQDSEPVVPFVQQFALTRQYILASVFSYIRIAPARVDELKVLQGKFAP